ncbi:MAG: hypothetical protein HDT30_01630 [Clostridiales bacterium]|nr:hypothetical protein [Clostridiales bacterium]
MMHTSAKAALGTYTNLAAKCKVLPKDSEYIEKTLHIILLLWCQEIKSSFLLFYE